MPQSNRDELQSLVIPEAIIINATAEGDSVAINLMKPQPPIPTRSQIETYIPSGGEIFDVIIAGGGPAGIGAALAAARAGARTLLLEARSCFGGVAALSHWMPLNRLFLNGGTRGGVHETFVRKIQSFGPAASIPGKTGWVNGDNLDIHPDYLKLAVFELLEEAGCCYRLYTPITGVIMDGAEIRGVVSHGKQGAQAFHAQVVVDATGDGDVAHLAGAPMIAGREEDGVFMPVTLSFVIGNVDEARFNAFLEHPAGLSLGEIIEAARGEGYALAAWHAFDPTTIPGVVSVNNGGPFQVGRIDGANVADLTLIERLGARAAVDFVRLAREKRIPGLEDCALVRTGAAVAVRETRRIVGEYVLTEADVTGGMEFPDVIARKYGEIDPGGLAEAKDYSHSMKSGAAYPYRCLLPQQVEGLLVAGRCGSATHIAHAAGKSMGNMMALGQAAGVAAALSVQGGIHPRQLAAAEIQAVLASWGVML